MFSLIISIIAIALAAVLLLTSAFYGGSALTQGTAKAKAAALANEAQQIAAAYDLYKVEKSAVPGAVADLVGANNYLKRAPAGGSDFDTGLTPQPWSFNTSGVLTTTTTLEICEKVNDSANGLTCDESDGVLTYNM